MPFHLVEPSMTKGEISRLFQVSLDTAAIRIHELGLDATDQSKLPVPLPGQRTRAPSNPPQISRPGVFVSMAYSPVMNRLYAEIFKPTIESLGMQALRADEIASVEPISLDIRRSIDDADLVIAEITDFNPNVMHEIGLAQSIDKPTIIICRMGYREDQIPSNIRHIRRIMYPNDAGGGPILRRHLQEILSLMCICFRPH